MNSHQYFMDIAIDNARKASNEGEVPVGAVIVKDDKIIAMAYNMKETNKCVVEHAEIRAIKEASKVLGNWHLDDCTLYVTLEPCLMCAGAIMLARIKTIVFGTFDIKGGAYCSTYEINKISGLNHYPEVISEIRKNECSKMLSDFFKNIRERGDKYGV